MVEEFSFYLHPSVLFSFYWKRKYVLLLFFKIKKELKQYSTLDLYQNTIILHLFLLTKNRKLGAFHFVVKEQLFSIWKNSHFFFWVLTTCGLPPVQLRGFHEDLTTLPRLETVLPTLSSTTIPLTWLNQ